jgi:hypothetical protein
MAKEKIKADEKFEQVEFSLFDAIAACDRKDYSYWDKLTLEQQKKFHPYVMLTFLSSVSGSKALQEFHVLSVNEVANKHILHESINKHPKLQFLMLCASTLGKGKQYHSWVPSLRPKVTKLQETATIKEINEFYSKLYPNADKELINEISEEYVKQHKRKVYLANEYPHLKIDEIELLNEIISDEEIDNRERDKGNI